ncbi:hypothetical protein D3C76_1464650 [compost metagenome]
MKRVAAAMKCTGDALPKASNCPQVRSDNFAPCSKLSLTQSQGNNATPNADTPATLLIHFSRIDEPL